MVEKCGMQEVWIPENNDENEATCNIFMSPEFKTAQPSDNNGKRALVLI